MTAPSPASLRLRSLFSATVLVLAACGGGGSEPVATTPPPPPPPAPPAATPLPSTLSVTVDPHIEAGRTAMIQSSAGTGTAGLRYTWDYGNGTTATTALPTSPTYAQPGRYEVRLTVTNELGTSVSAAAQLLVGQLATPGADVGCTGADRGGWCMQTARVGGFHFAANGTVRAAEASGTILQSTDGGQRWQRLSTGTSLNLAQVAFADDLNGWALGRDPDAGYAWRILRSTDGGSRWTAQDLDAATDLPSPTLLAVSASRALVRDRPGSRVTLDGGASWQRIAHAAIHVAPSGRAWIVDGNGRLLQSEDLGLTIAREVMLAGTVDAVHFADDRQGWVHATVPGTGAAKRHVVYRTSDGGLSWTAAATAGLPDTETTPYTSATLAAHVDGTAWLSLARNTNWYWELQFDYRSTDGGASWQPVTRPAASYTPSTGPTQVITSLSSRLAWFERGGGTVYLTRNGGADWQATGPANANGTVSRLLVPTPGTMLMLIGSRWYRSTDDGSTWSVPFKEPVPELGYPNLDIGRVAHFFDASRWWVTSGLIVAETIDAGANWTRRLDPASRVIPAERNRAGRLQFVSPTRAYYLVADAALSTSDSGATWTAGGFPQGHPYMREQPYVDADFRDERRGVYVSNELFPAVTPLPPAAAGYAHATRDGAASWTAVALPVSPRSVRWVNDTTVIVVGMDGGIARSTDGGLTWSTVSSGTAATLNRLTVQGSVAWAVGDAGTVRRSDDAGLTWTSVAVQATARLNEVKFFDARNGYIVGDRGTVLATTDGGTRWTAQATGTTQDVSTVHMTTPGVATLITRQGTILSTVTGGF